MPSGSWSLGYLGKIMETITIKDTTFGGKDRTRKFNEEEYVKQWTESIGVASLWMLVRTSFNHEVLEADQREVKKIRSLIEEMAKHRFAELLIEEE